EDDSASHSGTCQASSRNWRAMVWAKSPLGCSHRMRFRNSRSVRPIARASSSRPLPSTSPAWVSRLRATPRWSRAMLPRAMSSSRSGARLIHSPSRWATIRLSSPSASRYAKWGSRAATGDIPCGVPETVIPSLPTSDFRLPTLDSHLPHFIRDLVVRGVAVGLLGGFVEVQRRLGFEGVDSGGGNHPHAHPLLAAGVHVAGRL